MSKTCRYFSVDTIRRSREAAASVGIATIERLQGHSVDRQPVGTDDRPYFGGPFFQVIGWSNNGTVEIAILAEPSTSCRECTR